MVLNELFQDTNVEVEWDSGWGSFELEDVEYILQFLPIKPGNMIHAAIPNQPLTDRTFFFSFAAVDPDYGMPSDSRTDARQSIKVFSIVLQALEKVVAGTGADTVYFGGTTDDPDRLRLYQKLTDRYTKKHGWSIVSTTTVSLFGDTKKVWIAQKYDKSIQPTF